MPLLRARFMDEVGRVARPMDGSYAEVGMSPSMYRSVVWKPIRESAIVGVLCIVVPIVLVGQVIGLLYPGTLA